MELVQTKDSPAKIEISKQRFQICPDRSNQALIHGKRHIIREQRRFERRRVMPCSRVKHIGLDRIGQRRSERVLMIAKFPVELMESAFAHLRIALHQKRTERALA